MVNQLTHLDTKGRARMVNVGHKPLMHRVAEAHAFIRLAASTIRLLRRKALPKGDALTVAQIAGIQAAKDTARLIPLCHTLPLDVVNVDFQVTSRGVGIRAEAISVSKTGVEMEVLVAVSIAALALYDMCKAVDKKMTIGPIRLTRKTKKPAHTTDF